MDVRTATRGHVIAVTALAPMVWGTTYVVTTELLPPGRPLLAAMLRALPAGLVLVAATGVRPRGRWWWRSAVLGALNFAVFFSLLFTAAYRLPGGVAATVGSVQPLLVIGIAIFALGERATPRQVAAGGAAVVGVGLLVLDGGARVDGLGILAALGATASMATGSILVQRWGRPDVGNVTFAGWQLVAGGLLLVPVTFVAEGAPPALGVGNVAGYVYLATVGGAIAYTLWFRGIALLGARAATFLGPLSPLVATVIGMVMGDALSASQLLGAAIVLGSVLAARMVGPAARVAATTTVRSTSDVRAVRQPVTG